MIADFKLQAPGEFNGILAMEEFADRTKSIHCDDEANLITIEFSSKEEYDHAYKVWDWVNDKEDNTFTLVTKADQCGDPDVRDPYAVTDITFDESTLMAKLAATAQTWGDAVHDCELNTRTIHYTGKKARKARRQDDTSSDHWNSTVSEAEDAQNICDADDDEFCTNDYLDWELEEEDDVPDYEFLTPEIISTIDELERLEGRLTAANETNSTAQHPLQERVEKTYDLLLDLIDNRTMELLNDTAEMYGEELPEIGAAVANATTMYNQFMGEADLKFQEANKIAENDTDASWGLWEEALYLQDQATDVLQEALVAVTSHVQALHGIESEEDNVEARSLLRRSAKIHLQNKRNIGKWFADLGKKIKGAFVGVANGLANLLGANKPARLNLAQKFAPPKFTIDKNQYGIGFEAGPEFESGGNIVGLVEVKIQADKPSIFRVKVTPENIFAQAKYVVDADGTLKENFEKEIAGTTIPVPGAAIDIKGLIHIGPSVYAGLWAGIPKLEAKQAHFEVGAIARIPKDSVILLDIVNSKNNKVKGWTPNIEQIGPKFTGDLQGELAMWVSLALKFDANIFGGKCEFTIYTIYSEFMLMNNSRRQSRNRSPGTPFRTSVPSRGKY